MRSTVRALRAEVAIGALSIAIGGCGTSNSRAADEHTSPVDESTGGGKSQGPSGTGGRAAGATSGKASIAAGGSVRKSQVTSSGTIGEGGTSSSGGTGDTATPRSGNDTGAHSTGAVGGKAPIGGATTTDVPIASGGQSLRSAGGSGQAETIWQTGTGGTSTRATGGTGPTGGRTGTTTVPRTDQQRMISFGTLLNPDAVVTAAQELAKSQSNPGSAQWRAKGDQHRTYHYAEAGTDAPYRLYVPTTWDGHSELRLAMFLHGSGSDENTYVDQNNKQILVQAEKYGFLLVAPLGDKGAYGSFLRLSSPFGKPDEATKLMAQVTAASEQTNELSEQDVINVLELTLAEYPVNRSSMFLFGHSMGSGGTWYIGGKYSSYWKGLAPMSGPFVQETGYPWEALRNIDLFVTEGTQAPSLDGSRALRDWLKGEGFNIEYKEVNADHGGMVGLVVPDVFGFFDRS
ncbi:MAG TPA: hypothetical protein VKP30_26185 [Polyangiaceae bacterium]|nr:hypothetical protein [Polyangiaceae bacterium]